MVGGAYGIRRLPGSGSRGLNGCAGGCRRLRCIRRPRCGRPRWSGASSDRRVRLEGDEEALSNSIIPALARAAERLADVVLAEQFAEGAGGVLAAPVGVEDEPGCGTAKVEGHLHRPGDEFGAHVVGHGEADDAPAGKVDDGGEVGPALPGTDVGDISYPGRVQGKLTWGEGAPQEVDRPGFQPIGDGRLLEAALLTSPEPGHGHEPRHSLAGGVHSSS